MKNLTQKGKIESEQILWPWKTSYVRYWNGSINFIVSPDRTQALTLPPCFLLLSLSLFLLLLLSPS